MKARDIRAMSQGKVDPVVLDCICGVAESLNSQQQEIIVLAGALDKLTDILMQLGATVEGATNAVDEMKKIRGTDN
jgi:hypothetical protein